MPAAAAGLCLAAAVGARHRQVLWPLPRNYTSGSVTARLTGPLSAAPGDAGARHAAVAAHVARINARVGAADAAAATPLSLRCGGDAGAPLRAGAAGADESYRLRVAAAGGAAAVELDAAHWAGCLHGLATLHGLLEAGGGGEWGIPRAPWDITDEPAYTYRGLIVDTSRNFQRIPVLEKLIDGMQAGRLNVLHLHLTDTGGWPLQLAGMPELARLAVEPGATYTPAEMAGLAAYAEARGVALLPEIDSPGHAARAFADAGVDPALVKCTDPEYSTPHYAAEPPVAQYDITPSSFARTKAYFDKLWAGVAAALPSASIFHIGMDEVNVPCMVLGTELEHASEAAQKAGVSKWVSDWASAMLATMGGLNRTLMMWQDGYLNHPDVNVSSDVVLQMWNYDSGSSTERSRMEAACAAGTKIVQSRYQGYYMDCGGSNWISGGDSSWCPHVSWYRLYLASVESDLPAACSASVIGAEGALWSEVINEWNLMPKAFPRAWALGERLWSKPTSYDGDPTSKEARALWVPALNRLRVLQGNMDAQGVGSTPLGAQMCASRPELCDSYTNGL